VEINPVSPEFRNFAFTLVFFLMLVFILTTSYFSKHHIYVVHSSLPLLIVAIASSVLITFFSSKTIITNAITNEFIYKYLLPVIVLAEGFNLRKRSLSTFKREIVLFSIVCPILACALNAAILILSQKHFSKILGLDPEKKLSNEILISIAITMSTVEIHGSVGPLHAVKNLRLYKILFSSGLFNNNISLIIVMTFERMIHNKGKKRLNDKTSVRTRCCRTF
jgi:hypothetical protein